MTVRRAAVGAEGDTPGDRRGDLDNDGHVRGPHR